MDILYKITYDRKFYKDLYAIELRTTDNYYRKLKDRLNVVIKNLQFMPRTHKTIYPFRDPLGEYRRIILERYIIIYKIVKDEIIILRIFNQKENYLNQKKFILREDNQIYFINKRRIKMIKLRTLKNSYSRLKESFTKTLTEEEYVFNILEKAVEKLNSGKAVFYTHEEFWKLVRQMEVDDYKKEVSHNIRKRYA